MFLQNPIPCARIKAVDWILFKKSTFSAEKSLNTVWWLRKFQISWTFWSNVRCIELKNFWMRKINKNAKHVKFCGGAEKLSKQIEYLDASVIEQRQIFPQGSCNYFFDLPIGHSISWSSSICTAKFIQQTIHRWSNCGIIGIPDRVAILTLTIETPTISLRTEILKQRI